MALKPQFGRHGPRSKHGCTTCRTRKVKCDEQRPLCSRCAQAKFACEWDLPVQKRRLSIGQKDKSTAPKKSSRKTPLRPAEPNTQREKALRSESTELITTPQDVEVLTSTDTNRSLELYRGDSPGLLRPPLSTSHIALSNSLVLTEQDMQSFDYVPDSLMVLSFGKPWKWSMLSYAHSRIACREGGVMRAFIAVASMELRFLELLKYSDTTPTPESAAKTRRLKESATTHLHLALKDLSSILDRLSDSRRNPEDVEALFSLWFLILHVGLYDPDLSASHVHLNGIRSFLRQYMSGSVSNRQDKLPPASQQLLLFIAHHDVMLALGNMNAGQLSLDLLSAPVECSISFDQIFEQARRCLPKVWGSQYPVEELLDDLENYRGLSFLHVCQKLKLSVWKLGIASSQGKSVDDSRRRLWDRIEETGEQFCDLLTLARMTTDSGGRRVIWTVYHACLDYYAVKVLYTCIHGEEPFPPWLDGTLSELLAIAYKSMREVPQQIYRYAWSLTVAQLKVRDPIHKDWIQSQVNKAGVLYSNLGLPPNLLDGGCTPETLFLEYDRAPALELLV